MPGDGPGTIALINTIAPKENNEVKTGGLLDAPDLEDLAKPSNSGENTQDDGPGDEGSSNRAAILSGVIIGGSMVGLIFTAIVVKVRRNRNAVAAETSQGLMKAPPPVSRNGTSVAASTVASSNLPSILEEDLSSSNMDAPYSNGGLVSEDESGAGMGYLHDSPEAPLLHEDSLTEEYETEEDIGGERGEGGSISSISRGGTENSGRDCLYQPSNDESSYQDYLSHSGSDER